MRADALRRFAFAFFSPRASSRFADSLDDDRWLHGLLRSDEMYVFSTSQKRVSVEFVGQNKVQEKLKNFNDLTSASVSYMGVSSIGPPDELKSLVPSNYCSCPFYLLLLNEPQYTVPTGADGSLSSFCLGTC